MLLDLSQHNQIPNFAFFIHFQQCRMQLTPTYSTAEITLSSAELFQIYTTETGDHSQ